MIMKMKYIKTGEMKCNEGDTQGRKEGRQAGYLNEQGYWK
jgi:hypothetical protein